MENILQAFLEAGMLNMVDEDEKFKHLQQTAQELAGKPSKNRTDVIKSILVALDPEVPPNDPVLEKVETTLKKHWQTIKAKFPDVPRQLLRGILLETLRLRGEKDAKTAAVIWLTGASYFPHSNLGGEKSLCNSFLLEMGRIAEEKASKEWMSNYRYATSTIADADINVDVNLPSISVEALNKHLAAAAGPTDAQGEATEPDANPQWPNSGQAWSQKFAPRAATGIAEVVNKSYGELLQRISEVLKNSSIEPAVSQVARGAEITKRRSELLWWKQTLYSPVLMRSYRELDLAEAALLMGYDLFKQMPDFYPHSVEFLLREAAREIADDQESSNSKKLTLLEFCKRLKASAHAPLLVKALGSDANESGRVPLLSIVKRTLGGESLDSSQLMARIGIAGKSEIKFEELAVWILRDLKAHQLATQRG